MEKHKMDETGLEQEARKYATTSILKSINGSTDPDIPAINFDRYIAFKDGAEWQKEQMMKDAVDGIARPDDCEIWTNLKGYGYNLKDGDKIKIIIVKEN